MSDATVEAYRKRRQQRLDAKREEQRKTINDYHERVWKRLEARGVPFAERVAILAKHSSIGKPESGAESGFNGKYNLQSGGGNGIIGKENNLDANPDGTQWVTLENGHRIFIDKDGNILKGFGTGGNVKDLGVKYKELEKQAKTYASSERDPLPQEENDRRWSTYRQEVESAIIAGNFEGVQLVKSEEQIGYWGKQERSMTFHVEYDKQADLMNMAKNLQDTYQQEAVMVLTEGKGAVLETTHIKSKDEAIDLLKEAKVKFATVYEDRVEIVHSQKDEETTTEAFAALAIKRGVARAVETKEVSQAYADYGDSIPVKESERPRPQYPDDRK